jgi:hypothetical protein
LPSNAIGGVWDEERGEWIETPWYKFGDIRKQNSADVVNSKRWREMKPLVAQIRIAAPVSQVNITVPVKK